MPSPPVEPSLAQSGRVYVVFSPTVWFTSTVLLTATRTLSAP